MSPAEKIAMARDIAFLAMLVAWSALGFLLVRKVVGLARSARRTADSAGEAATTVSRALGRRRSEKSEGGGLRNMLLGLVRRR